MFDGEAYDETTASRDDATIVLVRGCGPLGRLLADGLARRGHHPVSLDHRTAAGTTEARRADLHRTEDVRRELLSLTRGIGPIRAVVLLPRDLFPAHAAQPWEHTAAAELLESAAIVRAAAPILGTDGRLIAVPRWTAQEHEQRRSTPAEAIVELGITAVATELGLALIRCLIPADEHDGGDPTPSLLAAITGPSQREPTVDVGLPYPASDTVGASRTTVLSGPARKVSVASVRSARR